MTKNNQKRLIIFFIVMFGTIASGYNSFLKPLDSMIINFYSRFRKSSTYKYIFKYNKYSRSET